LTVTVATGETLQPSKSGSHFSNPSIQVDLPEKWQKKPIVHGNWATGADFALSLDQHLYPALEESIREYEKANNLTIAAKDGTCGISVGELLKKTVDMAGLCCPPGKMDRLPGLEFHTMGITPIILITHPNNPAENLSLDEAKAIFKGEIANWSAIKLSPGTPGPDMPIQPVIRLHCKKRPGHWRLLLDNEDLFSPVQQAVPTIPDMIHSVSEQPNAIGWEAAAMINQYGKKWPVKALHLNGINPQDREALRTGRYPLYRTLGIAIWTNKESAHPEIAAFVQFLKERMKKVKDSFIIIPIQELKQSGWQFTGHELSGEPKQ